MANNIDIKEDMLLDLYKTFAYLPNDAEGNPLTPFGNFCAGYEAAEKQRQQEPVAFMDKFGNIVSSAWEKLYGDGTIYTIPIYTTPPDQAREIEELKKDLDKWVERATDEHIKFTELQEDNNVLQTENEKLKDKVKDMTTAVVQIVDAIADHFGKNHPQVKLLLKQIEELR